MSLKGRLREAHREHRDIGHMARQQQELEAKIEAGFATMEMRFQAARAELSALVQDVRAIRMEARRGSI